jgi:hypothetical protein
MKIPMQTWALTKFFWGNIEWERKKMKQDCARLELKPAMTGRPKILKLVRASMFLWQRFDVLIFAAKTNQ